MSASWNVDDFSIMDMNDMAKRAELAETPAEIEARIEARWLAEFRKMNDDRQEEISTTGTSCSIKWRNIVLSAVSRDPNLRGRIFSVVNLTTNTEFAEEEKEVIAATLDKLVTYLNMGLDFETIMTAVNSDDTLMSCWEVLMVSMKLGGYDQPLED